MSDAPLISLPPRMREVMALLVDGCSEKEVALHLGISPHTVHIHVSRLYKRLGVHSRAELLARIYRHALASAAAGGRGRARTRRTAALA